MNTATAKALAMMWHAGQLDANGLPYTEHLQRVASVFPEDSDENVVGWLHDCIEDRGITVQQLRDAGATERQISAISDISHIPKNEPNVVYWGRVKRNELALEVKKSDIMDNSNPDRLYYLPEERRWRMMKKYHRALRFFLLP